MWHESMEITKDALKEAKGKQKLHYDRDTRIVVKWEGPYVVKEKKRDVNYRIQLLNKKKILITHVDRMKLSNRDADRINDIMQVEHEDNDSLPNIKGTP